MDKKEILDNAVAELQTAAPKKPNFFVRASRWAKRRAAALWNWLCRVDKLVFFNIILLLLVIAMFCVMFGRVCGVRPAQPAKRAGQGHEQAERARIMSPARGRPTIVMSRSAPVRPAGIAAPARRVIVSAPLIATLPIKRPAPAAMPQRKVSGTLLINGRNHKAKLPPRTTIEGDLILQNMRVFSLPCGTRVRGNLLLRNVRLLKFCAAAHGTASFDIAGNIYVSSDSSFGPIPGNARLGGQVIF